MAGSIRICLIAEGFTEDLITCISAITKNTQTPITVYANGKSNWISLDQFDPIQVSLIQEKNPLGWGNVTNYFLNNLTEQYLVIMDPSTVFNADPIPEQPLDLVKYLSNEFDYLPWSAFFNRIGFYVNMLDTTKLNGDLQAYISGLVEPYYKKVDWIDDIKQDWLDR